MTHKLIIRPSAEADLDSIYDHIARDSPANAIGFVRRIREKCADLTMFAERGRLRDDLEPGLRILGFERRAVIAFRVLKGEVEVVRILYGGRDLKRIFQRE